MAAATQISPVCQPCTSTDKFQKALCFVPIIGDVMRWHIGPPLLQKMERAFAATTPDRAKTIELIKLRNQHLFSDVVRAILTGVACLVAAVALEVFGAVLLAFAYGGVAGFCLAVAPVHHGKIQYNKELIQEIEETGTRYNMKFK